MELRTMRRADGEWYACVIVPKEWVIAGMSKGTTERRAVGQLMRDIVKDIDELQCSLEQKRAALAFVKSSAQHPH